MNRVNGLQCGLVGWVLICVLFVSGCGVTPDISGTIEQGESVGVASLRQMEDCPATAPEGFGTLRYVYEDPAGIKSASVLGILAASTIGVGIDLLGAKLEAAGEEKSRSIEAGLNISDDTAKVSCFALERGDDIRVVFALTPPLSDGAIVIPGNGPNSAGLEVRVVALTYKQTIDRDTGTRGLALAIEAQHVGSTQAVSVTIPMGNVETGAVVMPHAVAEAPFVSGLLPNPFLGIIKNKEGKVTGVQPNLPFTLRARLHEVRNVNALAEFAADVVSDSNDALTVELLERLKLDQTASEGAEKDGDGAEEGGPDEDAASN